MGKEDQGLEDRLLWSNLFAQSRNSALTFCVGRTSLQSSG